MPLVLIKLNCLYQLPHIQYLIHPFMIFKEVIFLPFLMVSLWLLFQYMNLHPRSFILFFPFKHTFWLFVEYFSYKFLPFWLLTKYLWKTSLKVPHFGKDLSTLVKKVTFLSPLQTGMKKRGTAMTIWARKKKSNKKSWLHHL